VFDDIKKYSRMLFFAFYFLFNKNFSIQFKFFFFMCFLCFVCDVKKSWWANEREETYLPYGWMCLFIFLFVSKPLHIAYGYRVLYFLVFFFTKWWFLFVFQTLREEFFFVFFGEIFIFLCISFSVSPLLIIILSYTLYLRIIFLPRYMIVSAEKKE
jgi:hypothetical protein